MSSQILEQDLTEKLNSCDYTFKSLEDIYSYLPQFEYEYLGASTQPNGRSYLGIALEKGEGAVKIGFKKALEKAAEFNGGIAVLVNAESQPALTLHYGSVWSFLKYGDLRGAANSIHTYRKALEIDSSAPFAAKISDSNECSIGFPSDEFFPPEIKKQIEIDVLKLYPGAKLGFNLINRDAYAVPLRIAMDTGLSLTLNEKDELGKRLTWFMPPYLPIYIP